MKCDDAHVVPKSIPMAMNFCPDPSSPRSESLSSEYAGCLMLVQLQRGKQASRATLRADEASEDEPSLFSRAELPSGPFEEGAGHGWEGERPPHPLVSSPHLRSVSH